MTEAILHPKTCILPIGVFLLMVCFSSCSKDDTSDFGNLFGIVTDEAGDFVPNVTLTLTPGNRVTASGTDGLYEFLDLESGQYTVQAESDGFHSETKQAIVYAAKATSADFVLKRIETPPPPPVSPYFISFKYNSTAYEIRDDNLCIFTKYDESYYKITGVDTINRNAFTLVIQRFMEEGVTYNIYSSIMYSTPTIFVQFRSSDALIYDENYVTETAEVIGQLTITEKNEERLSGTFHCRMLFGDMTDGVFTVKKRVYE